MLGVAGEHHFADKQARLLLGWETGSGQNLTMMRHIMVSSFDHWIDRIRMKFDSSHCFCRETTAV